MNLLYDIFLVGWTEEKSTRVVEPVRAQATLENVYVLRNIFSSINHFEWCGGLSCHGTSLPSISLQ